LTTIRRLRQSGHRQSATRPLALPLPERQSGAMPCLDHNRDASYREKVIEHLLVGELLRYLWERGVAAEVLKPEVDAEGYDIVFEVRGVTRHVQLKASHASSSTARVNVHTSLSAKPSGCVVWSMFEPDRLRFVRFRFFGGSPGLAMPDISDLSAARHSRADSSGQKNVRDRLRVLPKGRFEELGSIAELAERLFGVAVTETSRETAHDDGVPELIPNEDLRPEHMPAPGAAWDVVSRFALTCDGYAEGSGYGGAAGLANEVRARFPEGGGLDALSLSDLRTCLFFEQRRYRHFGAEPEGDELRYVHELLEAIRRSVGA